MKSKPTVNNRLPKNQELKDPGKALILIYVSIILFFCLLGSFSRAETSAHTESGPVFDADMIRQGELLIARGEQNKTMKSPLLSQKVDLSVSGMVVNALVKQKFKNITADWVEAVYVFPLPHESAVKHLRMIVDGRVIMGEIQEKKQARQTYEKAKSEGKKTSLLAQKRPNIFTMAVANIPPHGVVDVEIEYLDRIVFDSNTFSLRFPMVVGPRYIPGDPLPSDSQTSTFDATGWAKNSDQVEDASQITPPVILPGESAVHPVELDLSLAPGFPVHGLTSLYHGVAITKQSDTSYTLSFDGRVFADRDFVVEYQPANHTEVAVSRFTEHHNGNVYTYLMVVPPVETIGRRVPREVVFVLDISGSMAGSSIRQAKEALGYAISRLQAEDRFNVIVFNSKAYKLFDAPLAAHNANRKMAEEKVMRLSADGGTEIAPALKLALNNRFDSRRIRQIIFLTDGAVGNEQALFQLIHERLGDSKLFTVGIGSAPNSFFMTRAAAMGRGGYTFIGKIEEVHSKMTALFSKLENPVISNLSLNLGSGVEVDMYPKNLPDLYMGEPLVCVLRSKHELGQISISGAFAGQLWKTSVASSSTVTSSGVATLWARKKIRFLMDALGTGAAEPEVRRQVTATALDHHLVSKYTSLVAVEQHISRAPGEKLQAHQMKNNMPTGWQYTKVFSPAAKTATRSQLVIIVGLLFLILAILLLRSIHRRGRVWT